MIIPVHDESLLLARLLKFVGRLHLHFGDDLSRPLGIAFQRLYPHPTWCFGTKSSGEATGRDGSYPRIPQNCDHDGRATFARTLGDGNELRIVQIRGVVGVNVFSHILFLFFEPTALAAGFSNPAIARERPAASAVGSFQE
jgi:hypothetical protein